MSFYRPIFIAALAAAGLHADVTLRYKTDVKLNPSLPAQMAEQATRGMQSALPPESVFQWKDGKGASAFGPFRSVVDIAKQQITIFDPEQKRYATTTSQGLMDEIAKSINEMPAEAKAAMASMKTSAEVKATGRTAEIHGIQAEEREVTLSIAGPEAAGPGPMIKMAIQLWSAKDAEAARVPALRELRDYNVWAYGTMNPAGSIERMFQQIPGMGEGLGKALQELQAAKAIMLRSKVTMWMPSLGAIMKSLPPDKNPFGANFDFDAPFVEMTQELSEVSNAPVAASAFVVPEGFRSVPASEIVKDMMAKAQAAVK